MRCAGLRLAVGGIAAMIFCGCTQSAGERVIPVAPGGNAIHAALAEVAKFRECDTNTPVTLRLAPGEYRLSRRIEITGKHARRGWARLALVAEDEDRRPRLVGGVSVRNWRKTPFNGRDDVWSADVAALSLPPRNPLLFYNGCKMQRARWPNLNRDRPYTSGYAVAVAHTEGKEWWRQTPVGMFEDELPTAARDRRRWANPTDGTVLAFRRHYWSSYCMAIRGLSDDGVFKLNCEHKPVRDVLNLWDRWCVLGLREELDRPGEWYFDRREQRMYFITPDGSDPNLGDVTVPVAPQMVKVSDGAANVTLALLDLACGKAGLLIEETENVEVCGCAIHDIGFFREGYAVTATGCRVSVRDNDIWNIGGHGISIGGPKGGSGFDFRCGNVARNNYIHHVGQDYAHGVGVMICGHGVEASHNLIHDTPRNAIHGYGRFCDISYNRIRHTNAINDDTGAIYGGGWTGGAGTTVRYNHISDSIGFKRDLRGQYGFFDRACGIYADEGCGEISVYGNLIERCHHAAMQLHNGRWITISNNVFVSNGSLPVSGLTGQLLISTWNNDPNGYFMKVRRAAISKSYHELVDRDPRWLTFPSIRQAPDRDDLCFNRNGTTIMGVKVFCNVFSYPDQGAGSMLFGQKALQLETNRFDCNLYWPGQTTNVVQRSGKAMNWREWREKGEDTHSVIADPLFTDPSAGDYRLRPESPAFALGFRELPYDKMGLELTRYRKTMPREAEGLREHPEWLQVEARLLPDDGKIAVDGSAAVKLGAGVVSVTSTGEVSFVRISWPHSFSPGALVLNDAFRRASRDALTIEPLDWIETKQPLRWRDAAGVHSYDWECVR